MASHDGRPTEPISPTGAAADADAPKELVPSVSIENILQQRAAIVDRVLAAQVAMKEANQVAASFLNDTIYELRLSTSTHRDFADNVDSVVAGVDTAIWRHLLEQSGMRSFLDTKARNQWDESMAKREVPALTRENIEATFARLYEDRASMFERGVVDVFKSLSWDYKTNLPVRFGKKLILKNVVDTPWCYARASHNGCNRLDDLLRVMAVLDSEPETDFRRAAYHQLNVAKWPKSGDFAFPYFTVRGFKNGNAHLTFTRLDLVDELNRILARQHPNALPENRDP